MPQEKCSQTKKASFEDFPCGICRNNYTSFSIQCFKCLIWLHVNCTDLPEENFRTLGNINGCFWACLYCRSQVVIPQDQSNIKDELSQKIEDMKSNLKSEIESFKTENRDCTRNVHTNTNSKKSETEKQLQVTKTKFKKVKTKTKLIFFGVDEKPKDDPPFFCGVDQLRQEKS